MNRRYATHALAFIRSLKTRSLSGSPNEIGINYRVNITAVWLKKVIK